MFGDESVTREIFGNVPGWLAGAFYAAALVSCAAAAVGFVRRARVHRRGRANPAGPRPTPARRLREAAVYLTFHRQLRRDRWAGAAHLLMFYGFAVLLVGTTLVAIEYDTPLHFMYGDFYCWMSLGCDLGGAALLAGTGMFLWRRIAGGPGRILREWWVTAVAVLLFVIGVTGFVVEAARIAQTFPPFERWSVVGYPLARLMAAAGVGPDEAALLHRVSWGFHAAVCVAFFAMLPSGFFAHAGYGLASWAGRKRLPLAALPVIPSPPGESPGAFSWDQLTRNDLLQADACTTCGRCNEVCPAAAAGKPLRPREVVLGIRKAVTAGSTDLREFVADDAVWSCTTCGACNHACPVGIGVYDKVIELRRGRVEAGEVPPAAERLFEATADRSNPFGRPADDRLGWATGLPVKVAAPGEPIELLYWVGCAGSFDPDGRSVARSVVAILEHLGVNYRVLGKRERCTGDPARRMGEEGLFRELASANADRFEEHRVRTILTHCPHCFNTFANEYPQLRPALAGWRVVHHTQFLSEHLASGRLKLGGESAGRVTFHDPCYLGRGNGEVAAPRATLLALPQVETVEMPRSGERSFCCGAGGGAMWLDVRGTERVENLRYAEARATGAATVATGCPFCKTMLRTAGESAPAGGAPKPAVKDIAELVAEALPR